MTMLKSKVGMPAVQFTGKRIDLAAQARRARQRLYPATVLYSAYATSVFVLALATTKRREAPVAFYLSGWLVWTVLEYLAHRFVLHYRFPEGPGVVQHWLHHTLDNLHTEHHARPWDGNHINGTIKDTLLYMVFFGAASFLAPLDTGPVLWAGVMQAYVVEEWVHQGTHYPTLYGLRGPYWNYIIRHHSYHHSPRGAELAFGLTNGFWDIVFGTRVPDQDRRLLYGRRRAELKGARAT